MNNISAPKQIKSLTGIRGIAALYVMFYHWAYFFFQNEHASTTVEYIKLFLSHGNWCVDLFFVLSGFLLSMTSFSNPEDELNGHSYYNFMIKRFCRIYPIYFILTMVYFFLEMFFAKEHPSVLDYLFNLTLFQAITDIKNIVPTAWSLSVEWIIYFFFPLAIIMTNKVKEGIKIFILYAVTVILIIFITNPLVLYQSNIHSEILTLKFTNNVSNYIDGYKSLLRGLCSYALGIAAYSFLKNRYDQKISIYVLYIMFFAQIICLFIANNSANVVFILLLPFTMLVLVKEKSVLNKFFGSKLIYFLGEISFSLYLIHYVFVMSITTKLANLLMQRNIVHYKVFTFIIILTAVIFLSSLLYYYLEKPLNQLLRKRLVKKRQPKIIDYVVPQ